MKIIQHPNTFLCEKSGIEFAFDYLAKASENYQPKPIPTKFNVGDIILCQSRYDGYLEATIENFITKYTNPFENYDKEIWFRKGKYFSLRELAKTACFAHILIHTKEEIEICKDGSCTDLWYSDEVYLSKELNWVTTEPPKDKEIFIKVFRKSTGHLDTVIFKNTGRINTLYFNLIEWAHIPEEK